MPIELNPRLVLVLVIVGVLILLSHAQVGDLTVLAR